MARTLDQIYAELDKSGGYLADRELLNNQLSVVPKQQEAAISAADAKLAQANDNIIQGARSRGLGFSGIPIGEQAKYAATDYAPAIANIKAQGESQRMGILQSLNQLSRDQRNQSQSIFDTERNFEEQQRQFNAQLEAQRQAAAASAAAARAASYSAGAGSYLGASSGGAAKAASPSASYGFKNGKDGTAGFYFIDAGGKSISAAKYAALTGTNMTQLIAKMGSAGDKTAAGLIKGPGVVTNSSLYRNAFAWDV